MHESKVKSAVSAASCMPHAAMHLFPQSTRVPERWEGANGERDLSHRLNAFIKTQKRTASVAVAAKNATHLADDLLPRATKRARVAESASTSAREWGLYTYSPLSLPPSCTHSSLQVCISVCICEMEAYVSGMWAWQQHCVCCLSFAVWPPVVVRIQIVPLPSAPHPLQLFRFIFHFALPPSPFHSSHTLTTSSAMLRTQPRQPMLLLVPPAVPCPVCQLLILLYAVQATLIEGYSCHS